MDMSVAIIFGSSAQGLSCSRAVVCVGVVRRVGGTSTSSRARSRDHPEGCAEVLVDANVIQR